MGLDITVMTADCSWLEEVPPRERVPRLRSAWYADETGLWGHDAPAVESGWVWPQGPDSALFAVYEFPHTCGSFKAHFWAGQRWEAVRDHVDPPMRAAWDTFLRGLVWCGMDGEAQHTDTGFFGEDDYGVLLARSPDSVRELAAVWDRARPCLGRMEGPFGEHAADPDGWVGDFGGFTGLLAQWGQVVTEAARRGWGVVGLSE
ncbi:hypothetical protein ACMATS_34760 [Streptoverticillium reticulum]|uniref:hypothetical protein n=1 Tax=Streptoverticillium reticulum TaxID=1433415 RepID=UPI0039BF5005